MTGRRAQRGVAVVVAVLVVALATSTAAYILWHQSLWLRQVENITARAQADALARAAAAWAAAILAEDDPAIDHLGETWARRMPPFPAEHAELAGSIADEQAKFNVNNLAGEGGANPRQLLAFQVDRARRFYRKAEAALPRRDERRMVAARIMGAIYYDLLRSIERARYDVFSRRVRVRRPRQALVAAVTWLKVMVPFR